MRDPAFIERIRPLLELYVRYYRPEVRGFENVPKRGPFLLVGNHSGGATPPDMPILLTAWWRERGVDDPVYGLFHSFFINLPGLRGTLERAGAMEAGQEQTERILRDGGIVLLYPGGDHEAFRPWTVRNRIDFAGRKGFIRVALRNRVPIVPVVTHGVQDSIFVVSRGERLARYMPHLRLWRLKVMPVMIGPPWGVSLGLPTFPVPLSKATVQICPALDLAEEFGPQGAEDPDVLQACYDRITSDMQHVLDGLSAQDTSSKAGG